MQTLVGIGQVGTPTGVVNNDSIALFRLIAGFMLLFIGIVNVVIGMASSYDIRYVRAIDADGRSHTYADGSEIRFVGFATRVGLAHMTLHSMRSLKKR